MKMQYSMLIEWSEEDQVYIVSLPEFGEFVKTHGETYTEAVRNGEEVIEMMLEHYQESQESLPAPRLYNHEAGV